MKKTTTTTRRSRKGVTPLNSDGLILAIQELYLASLRSSMAAKKGAQK